MLHVRTLYYFMLVLISFCSCKTGGQVSDLEKFEIIRTKKLDQIDGPYIYDKTDSVAVISVEKNIRSADYFIKKQTLKKLPNQKFSCTVNNSDKDQFNFVLRPSYSIPSAVYPEPEKIFVTSDVEGNFNAFYGMLVGNGIMDKAYNWTFGKGHLVIGGDMVDRGNNAWPCLWLLYKLEQDAEKHGGKVHYILGNHDVMNMHGNLKYVKDRYIELAKILSGKSDEKKAWFELLADTNELVKWIKTKNTIEQIGANIYVHGGVSLAMVKAGLTINQVNDIVRKNIRKNLTNYPGKNKMDNLVFSRLGPLWYRGLVKDYKDHYKKVSAKDLDAILDFYGVNRIIVGHTIVDDEVTSDFKDKIIRVDIKHPYEKFNGKSQGLLIENNTYYKATDAGEKYRLF